MSDTTTVHAYAAPEAGAPFEPFEFELGPIGHDEVEIEVTHCGICHSDQSMRDNEWGMTTYPFVGGHEVEGRIAKLGAGITNFAVGDRVGAGWFSHTDPNCPCALAGNHKVSPTSQGTIVGRHGGFADRVRVQGTWAFPLNDGIPTGEAGPMFCGGATVWTPFQKFASPTHHVGVVGIGGLGHLALKFARSWGCHVTAFTSTESKRTEALALGAHDVVVGSDPAALEARAGTLDLLITTVAVPIDWDAYLGMVGPHGRVHVVGAVLEPIPVGAFSLIIPERTISGSPVATPAHTRAMVDFAGRHGIAPTTEHFPLASINEAFARLAAGDVRYRAVLDIAP
jgi:alcohol/geraniol dehydrogenase (NADP+)